jgi:hypothetical protein
VNDTSKPLQQEILESVATMISAPIGQLPTGAGTVIRLAPGLPRTKNLDDTSEDTIGVLVLSKATDEPSAFAPLYTICNTITTMGAYPQPIYNISVRANPSPVIEEGGYIIYSCLLLVRFFNDERG